MFLNRDPLARIFRACNFVDIKFVQQLVEADPDIVYKKTSSGTTPLMHAATRGCFNAVQCLIALGTIDPTLEDTAGRTALSLAVEFKHMEVALLFYNRAKDPSASEEERQKYQAACKQHEKKVGAVSVKEQEQAVAELIHTFGIFGNPAPSVIGKIMAEYAVVHPVEWEKTKEDSAQVAAAAAEPEPISVGLIS